MIHNRGKVVNYLFSFKFIYNQKNNRYNHETFPRRHTHKQKKNMKNLRSRFAYSYVRVYIKDVIEFTVKVQYFKQRTIFDFMVGTKKDPTDTTKNRRTRQLSHHCSASFISQMEFHCQLRVKLFKCACSKKHT